MSTHLQWDSPRGADTHTPLFLQGLGEHETKPAQKNNKMLINIKIKIIYFQKGYKIFLNPEHMEK